MRNILSLPLFMIMLLILMIININNPGIAGVIGGLLGVFFYTFCFLPQKWMPVQLGLCLAMIAAASKEIWELPFLTALTSILYAAFLLKMMTMAIENNKVINRGGWVGLGIIFTLFYLFAIVPYFPPASFKVAIGIILNYIAFGATTGLIVLNFHWERGMTMQQTFRESPTT